MSVTERYTAKALPRVLRIGQVWKHRKDPYYVVVKQIYRHDKQVRVHDLGLLKEHTLDMSELAKMFEYVPGAG